MHFNRIHVIQVYGSLWFILGFGVNKTEHQRTVSYTMSWHFVLPSTNDAVKVRLSHACPADEFNNTEDAQVSGIEYNFGGIIMAFTHNR